jgi:outer membrane immunogenic protein
VTTVPAFANVTTFGVIAADLANATALSATRDVSVHDSGFIGGGQVGYNWQFGNSWVAGIEADIQGTGARGSGFETGVAPLTTVANSAAVSSLSVNSAVDYLGTVRGRIGFLWTPTFLVFGDGGFAYGGVHENVEIVTNFLVPVVADGVGTFPAFGNMSNTRPGWTAGGGFEWMFLPNWSAKVEYLYYDLGRRTLTVGGLNVPTTIGNVFTDLPFVRTLLTVISFASVSTTTSGRPRRLSRNTNLAAKRRSQLSNPNPALAAGFLLRAES